MATKTIGKARCTECDSINEVKDDNRKLFITCKDCGTMTQFQAKDAQAKIKERMAEPDALDEDVPEHTPVGKKSGVFDSYADWF